jgi:DNA-binding NtrC family response regulator
MFAPQTSASKAMPSASAGPVPSERSLLIVEDDKSFLQRLARAMESRGFVVTTAESVADGLLQVREPPLLLPSLTCDSATATASTLFRP